VWDPGDRFVNETGLVHAAHAAPSRLHSNVPPDPVRVAVAVVAETVPVGRPVTVGAAGETISVAVALTFTALGASLGIPPYSTK